MPVTDDPEFREVRLIDIVRVVHRRKIVLGSTFLAALLVGVAVTAFMTPEYESTTSIVPLEHSSIIQNWLSSRRAAEIVVERLDGPIEQGLFPDRWDSRAQQWKGAPPSVEESAVALQDRVAVTSTSTTRTPGATQQLLILTAGFPDPVVARDVAQAYVASLSSLRPELENITRQQAFDKYYDGTNEQQARQRAELLASETQYWILIDPASLPASPARPEPVLNLALAASLGLVLGILLVFLLEWISKYRVEVSRLDVPEERETPAPEVRGDRIGSPRSPP